MVKVNVPDNWLNRSSMVRMLPKKQNKKLVIGSLILCQEKDIPDGLGIILNLTDKECSIFWTDFQSKDCLSNEDVAYCFKTGKYKHIW